MIDDYRNDPLEFNSMKSLSSILQKNGYQVRYIQYWSFNQSINQPFYSQYESS